MKKYKSTGQLENDVNTIKEIIIDHYNFKKQLIKLAKADIAKTYKGAVLGWAWALVKPAITIFVYWFAFAIGLKVTSEINGYPYYIWLIAGLIPWFYMRDMIIGGTGALRKYSYLVTKIKFPICTIPTFINLSLLAVNMVLHIIFLAIYIFGGFAIDLYCIQIVIYLIAMFVLLNMWGLFASMLAAISKDFLNLIKSIVLALFWLSGIMYDVNNIDVSWIRELMLWNPITIIVNGYRNCFIYKKWFWETPDEIVRFIIVFCIMAFLAIVTYKKLKKDVPDVL